MRSDVLYTEEWCICMKFDITKVASIVFQHHLGVKKSMLLSIVKYHSIVGF